MGDGDDAAADLADKLGNKGGAFKMTPQQRELLDALKSRSGEDRSKTMDHALEAYRQELEASQGATSGEMGQKIVQTASLMKQAGAVPDDDMGFAQLERLLQRRMRMKMYKEAMREMDGESPRDNSDAELKRMRIEAQLAEDRAQQRMDRTISNALTMRMMGGTGAESGASANGGNAAIVQALKEYNDAAARREEAAERRYEEWRKEDTARQAERERAEAERRKEEAMMARIDAAEAKAAAAVQSAAMEKETQQSQMSQEIAALRETTIEGYAKLASEVNAQIAASKDPTKHNAAIIALEELMGVNEEYTSFIKSQAERMGMKSSDGSKLVIEAQKQASWPDAIAKAGEQITSTLKEANRTLTIFDSMRRGVPVPGEAEQPVQAPPMPGEEPPAQAQPPNPAQPEIKQRVDAGALGAAQREAFINALPPESQQLIRNIQPGTEIVLCEVHWTPTVAGKCGKCMAGLPKWIPPGTAQAAPAAPAQPASQQAPVAAMPVAPAQPAPTPPAAAPKTQPAAASDMCPVCNFEALVPGEKMCPKCADDVVAGANKMRELVSAGKVGPEHATELVNMMGDRVVGRAPQLTPEQQAESMPERAAPPQAPATPFEAPKAEAPLPAEPEPKEVDAPQGVAESLANGEIGDLERELAENEPNDAQDDEEPADDDETPSDSSKPRKPRRSGKRKRSGSTRAR